MYTPQYADSRVIRSLARRPLHALLCSLLYCGAAEASVRFVTSCADDNSAGTLRSQVTAGSGGSIDLSTLSCATIALTQGSISYLADLDITGPTDRRISIVGNGNDRVFLHDTTAATLFLENVTVSGGRLISPAINGGGCILTNSSVVLTNSIVTDCRITLDKGLMLGGAIYAGGYIGLKDSTVSDSGASAQTFYAGSAGAGMWSRQINCVGSAIRNNAMVGAGAAAGGFYAKNATLSGCSVEGNAPGGALIVPSTVANVTNSTIALNTGGDGLEVTGRGNLVITNSTISGNSGGGIFAPDAAMTLRNSTVFANGDAGGHGGVYSAGGVYARSSIFANNLPYDVYLGRSGTLYGANNLVVFTNATDQSHIPPAPGVIVSAANPRLAPLGYHGGTTRTQALLASSPAIDQGENSAGLATDQRGAPRELPAGRPDIGAYERQPNDDELFYNGFQ